MQNACLWYLNYQHDDVYCVLVLVSGWEYMNSSFGVIMVLGFRL